MSENIENIAWSTRVHIFRNSITMKQLGVAVGIPFGLLIIFLIIVKAICASIIIAALFLVIFLFILVVWGGEYDVDFELNKTEISSFIRKQQANKNSIINSSTVFLGQLLGKLGVSGAGLLAESRQNSSIKWSAIRKVKFLPEMNRVMIRAGYTEKIALFCTPENYTVVESLIRTTLKGKGVIYSTKGSRHNDEI